MKNEMAQVDSIRNGIIDQLLTISDKEYLTKEQKWMLEMSETDIQQGRLISQSDLDKKDLEWLNQK